MSGGEVIVKLTRAIKAHNEELQELTLREPTGDDVIEVGYPYIIVMRDGEQFGVELRARVIYQYISRLASIPLSSAKQIALRDISQLQGVIMSFFGESSAETPISSPD